MCPMVRQWLIHCIEHSQGDVETPTEQAIQGTTEDRKQVATLGWRMEVDASTRCERINNGQLELYQQEKRLEVTVCLWVGLFCPLFCPDTHTQNLTNSRSFGRSLYACGLAFSAPCCPLPCPASSHQIPDSSNSLARWRMPHSSQWKTSGTVPLLGCSGKHSGCGTGKADLSLSGVLCAGNLLVLFSQSLECWMLSSFLSSFSELWMLSSFCFPGIWNVVFCLSS